VYQLPGEVPLFLNCLAEVSAEHNPSVFSLLGRLRDIRDNMLQQTEKGQSLSSLYYSISKEVVDDAIFNSDFRNSVANDLKELTGVIEELQKISDGENSVYKLTKHDVEVMQHLKETVENKASKESIELLNKHWKSLQLEDGDSLSESINDLD
jgi:predicted ATP-dependent protease